jgi:GTPase SAR1 family protein
MTQAPPPAPNKLDRKVATIGLPGHGKTLFLASLFYDSCDILASYLDGYTINTVGAVAHQMFYENAKTIKKKELPHKTLVQTPQPATLRFKNVPCLPWVVKRYPEKTHAFASTVDINLTFYDIAGEPFQRIATVKQFASYIEQADDIIFLFDPSDPEFNAFVGAELVDAVVNCYDHSLQKNVIIVVSKMDELKDRSDFSSLIQPLYPDIPPAWPPKSLPDTGTCRLVDYLKDMQELSDRLRNHWWRSPQMRAAALINKLDKRTTHYCAISALGHKPIRDAQTGDMRLEQEPAPFRVRDPLFWIFKAAGAL